MKSNINPKFRSLGVPAWRGEAAARTEPESEAAVLVERSKHVVFKVSAEESRAEDQDRSPLPGHVQGQGTVLQLEGVRRRLQVPARLQHEPSRQM